MSFLITTDTRNTECSKLDKFPPSPAQCAALQPCAVPKAGMQCEKGRVVTGDSIPGAGVVPSLAQGRDIQILLVRAGCGLSELLSISFSHPTMGQRDIDAETGGKMKKW